MKPSAWLARGFGPSLFDWRRYTATRSHAPEVGSIPASQSRKQSCIEVATGTGIGMVGSWLISFASYACIESLPLATTAATAGCTVWSLVRGYCVRRYFNARREVSPA